MNFIFSIYNKIKEKALECSPAAGLKKRTLLQKTLSLD
jgi:hypothetical protein